MLFGPFDAGTPASSGSAVASADQPPTHFAARIAIVHGNRMMGELLRAQCVRGWGCEVVALEFSSGAGLAAAASLKPDLMLIGHVTPTTDALALLPLVRAASAGTKLVVGVERLTDYLVHRLSHTDVDGVVEESIGGISQLRLAIERIRSGARFLGPEFIQAAARLRANPDSFPKLLSDRQEAVLICIAQAMDDREIARCLGMSPATAQRHRSDIMHKLGLHGTPRLIRYALQAGFNQVLLPTDRKKTKAIL